MSDVDGQIQEIVLLHRNLLVAVLHQTDSLQDEIDLLFGGIPDGFTAPSRIYGQLAVAGNPLYDP